MSNLKETGGIDWGLYGFFLGKDFIQKPDLIPEGQEKNNDDEKKNADQP